MRSQLNPHLLGSKSRHSLTPFGKIVDARRAVTWKSGSRQNGNCVLRAPLSRSNRWERKESQWIQTARTRREWIANWTELSVSRSSGAQHRYRVL